MKIAQISYNNSYIQNSIVRTQKPQVNADNNKLNTPTSIYTYPHTLNLANLSFGSRVVRQSAQNACPVFEQFKYEPVDTLQYIKNTPMSPSEAFSFLCHATSDSDTSIKVARDLSSDPRQGEEIKSAIIEKLGGNAQAEHLFNIWLHDEAGGYKRAYNEYYNNEVWANATDLQTLLKQSPNIAPWALMGKAQELNTEFVFGQVPEDIGDIDTYRELIQQIKRYDFYSEYHKAKAEEQHKQTSDTMASASQNNDTMRRYMKPASITVQDREFEVMPLVQSFSSKLIYSVTSKNDPSKQYILKLDPLEVNWDPSSYSSRRFSENQALRPDMPYLNAVVDFYLKENQSQNAPDIQFYDYNTKSVLYTETSGEEPQIPDEFSDNLYLLVKYGKIDDIRKLGVELSDVHSANFKIDNDGNYRLIDSGHVKYSNIFRPAVVSKHIILGNLCGRELCK